MGRRYGGKMPKNMNNMMKQMQQVQKEMEESQKKIEEQVVEASSGGGVVSVSMNGKREIVSLTIDPDIVDPDDVEMLEDLVTAAFTACLSEVEKVHEDQMSKLTGGLNIPGF